MRLHLLLTLMIATLVASSPLPSSESKPLTSKQSADLNAQLARTRKAINLHNEFNPAHATVNPTRAGQETSYITNMRKKTIEDLPEGLQEEAERRLPGVTVPSEVGDLNRLEYETPEEFLSNYDRWWAVE